MRIENKFTHGQEVYLVTDPEQNKRLIYGIVVYENDLLYKVAFGTTISEHYTFELSADADIVMKTTN